MSFVWSGKELHYTELPRDVVCLERERIALYGAPEGCRLFGAGKNCTIRSSRGMSFVWSGKELHYTELLRDVVCGYQARISLRG